MAEKTVDRRDTPLLEELRAIIWRDGPMPVHEYMRRCVEHYYARGEVLGRAGDFVTAPEISQIFGELIGLWCAVVWQQMGSPARFNLIELGPGRGTMLRDMLRALGVVPQCMVAARVHLIEPSEAMQRAQAETLAGCGVPVGWPGAIDSIEAAPSIVVANEYLDTLPVHQLVRQGGEWRIRCAAVDADGRLRFETGPPAGAFAENANVAALLASLAGGRQDGDIIELRPPSDDLRALEGLRAHGAAMLVIDYGHARSGLGDTLQAVRSHGYDDPLASPGEADLTSQVDFAALGRELRAHGWSVDGPTTQAAFLSALGITERAARLMAANPAQANAIEMGVARLMSPSGMGTRFQVVGVRSGGLASLPGLPPQAA
jgi:SAM-dependent MidA family methyltransferase